MCRFIFCVFPGYCMCGRGPSNVELLDYTVLVHVCFRDNQTDAQRTTTQSDGGVLFVDLVLTRLETDTISDNNLLWVVHGFVLYLRS